jgi:hypothetical protein
MAIHAELKNTVSGVVRIEKAIETTSADLNAIKSISGDVAAMRTELELLRSGLNFRGSMLNRQSDMDRGHLEVKLDTLEEYVEKITSTGGRTTEQEIWEIVWDFLEAYSVVGDQLFILGSTPTNDLLTA